MRSSPLERLWRPKSLRTTAIVVSIVCASNMIGCHGGRRSSMRPRFLTSTTRSQTVVVDQGYTTVESPGAIIQQEQGAIIQQEQGAIIQQEQGAIIQQQGVTPGGQASEPPIILEPRQGGPTSSVVPSYGDPIESNSSGSSSELKPRRESPDSGTIDSLAPPVEAPQVILERPPIGNLDGPIKTDSKSIDSTIRKPEPTEKEEPRLEVVPPGSAPGVNDPAGSGGKEPAAAKTSAWRNQKPDASSGRITYQASQRKNLAGSGKPGDPLGVID